MLMHVNTVSEHVDTSSVGWTETRTGSKHGDMRVKNCLGKANETQRLLDVPPAERATAQLPQQIIDTRTEQLRWTEDTDQDQAETADAVDMLDTYRLYKVKKNIPWWV